MRRILYYSLLCLLWISVNSCKDDEAAQPPTPSFTVNRTTGLYQSTEFVFTIEQVTAGAVSLLPYGADHVNDAGILVPASAFQDGKATVKFIYGKVGTFQAVVLANNHTGDGESIKNATSAATAITITSDRAAMIEFSLAGKGSVRGKESDMNSTKTTIDTVARTIDVVVPYSTDPTKLKAKYKASDESVVTVGGAVQKSEETVNDFTGDVVYTVTSQDGGTSKDWTVHVDITPIQTDNKFKSFQGISGKKVFNKGRVLPSYIDTVDHHVILYDTLHAIAPFDVAAEYDSVALDYGVRGSFAYLIYNNSDPIKHVGGKDTIDVADNLKYDLVPQDSNATVSEGRVTYDLEVVEAPKLHVSFPAPLNPAVSGSSNEAFAVSMPVLQNTDLTAILTNFTFDVSSHDGATVTEIMVKDDNNGTLTDASAPFSLVLNYKKPVTLKVTVARTGKPTFVVSYTISTNVLKP